jgi:hypothetical protein
MRRQTAGFCDTVILQTVVFCDTMKPVLALMHNIICAALSGEIYSKSRRPGFLLPQFVNTVRMTTVYRSVCVGVVRDKSIMIPIICFYCYLNHSCDEAGPSVRASERS